MKSKRDYCKVKWSYSKRYYITHPWEIFKELFYHHKVYIQRAKYGFSYYDMYDMDSYLLGIIPEMLEYLSNNCHGWPDGKYESMEEWKQRLQDIAKKFDKANEEYFEINYDKEKVIKEAFDALVEDFRSLWD